MKRTILLAVFALITACGETSGGSGRTGTGGSGGAAPPPQSVDDTCRDWCANEPQGASCHQGPFESVQPCYESCVAAYQQEVGRECGDEWIAIKDCQVEWECADLFGDCGSVEEAFFACGQRASNRAYCEEHCPNFDVKQCEQDTTECRQFAVGVGAPCTASEGCDVVDEIELECLTEFAGGYCGLEGCMADDECPEGSACVTSDNGKNYCYRLCKEKLDCNYKRSVDNESNCVGNLEFVDSGNERKACEPPSSG